MHYINPTLMTNIRASVSNEKINTSSLSNWAKVKHCVLQSSILGSLLFLIYIYMSNLPKVINNRSIPVFLPMTLVFYSATPILKVLRKILMLYLKL